MTYYDWICNDCEQIWEQDHPIGTAPKETECPKCGELRSRNWGSVTTFSMKGDCHTNRVRMRESHRKGWDKDTAEDFYDAAIKTSKSAVATGWKSYSKMTPNIEKLRAIGAVRKRSPREAAKAKENAKKMTETVYNDVGIKISDTLYKPQ